MTATYVFLGPSLALDDARAILPDAVYLPPARMGDVQAVMAREPRVICLIDGYFERVPAVWHKELLYALSRGVRVIGASSIGALRAAELHAFGMEGVGAVFEAYRDGVIEDDDEVALVHGPADESYRALSEPLVNIRFALAAAERDGAITAASRHRLLAAARQRFYPERSWPAVFHDGAALDLPAAELDALRRMVAATRPNIKGDDARRALATAARARAPAPPPFDFEPTVFWRRLAATTSRAAHDSAVMSDEVVCHARAVLPDLREALRHMLLTHLIPIEAERLGITVTESEIAAAADAFRRERGLVRATDTRAWLERQGLTEGDFAQLARTEALLDKLLEFHDQELGRDAALALELRRQGRFAAIAEAAARRRASIQGAPDDRELVAWHERTAGPIVGSLDAHARRRGFKSRFELLKELAAAYDPDAPDRGA